MLRRMSSWLQFGMGSPAKGIQAALTDRSEPLQTSRYLMNCVQAGVTTGVSNALFDPSYQGRISDRVFNVIREGISAGVALKSDPPRSEGD